MAANELTPEEIKKQKRREYYRARPLSPEQRERRKENVRRFRVKHPEYAAESRARFRKENPEIEKKRTRAWYETHKELTKQRAAAARARNRSKIDPSRRIRLLVLSAKGRAKKAGRDFDEAIHSLALAPPTACPCCQREIDYTRRGVRGKWNSASLDRFNSAKGYVAGNVRIICTRCNTLKNNASVEELEAVVAYMRRG